MEIKRSSWHYKISNLGSDFERRNDNLCFYFWRGVGKLILLSAGITGISFFMYVYFTSATLIANTIMVIFVCSVFALPPLAIYLIRKKFGKSPEMPYGNIVVEYIAAKKRKICPLIEYI